MSEAATTPAPEGTPAPTGDAGASSEQTVVTSLVAEAGTPPADNPAPTEPAKTETSEEKPAEAEPFAFDKLTVPEGVEVPEEAKGAFSEIVNEFKMPADAAQKMIDLYATQAKAAADAAVKAWTDMNTDWQKQVKEDKEIGGANFDKTMQVIAKVVNDPNLTDPGFKHAMNLTGAGNNPAVIKSLYKWATLLSEGAHVGGSPPGGNKGPRNLGEALYGPQEGN